jgi:GAF domain-containing protein
MSGPSTASEGANGAGERLASVLRHDILDTSGDGTLDRVVELAATVLGTPIATVGIVAADRVWLAATRGLDGREQFGVEPGLCASAVLRDGPYVVGDAAADPRTADHPLVRGELALRFYAAAPIVTADGYHLGTVSVIDRTPRTITDEQSAVLTTLAGLVAEHLDLRLAALDASRAERGLREESEQRSAGDAELSAQLRRAAAQQQATSHPSTCQLGGSRRRCDRPAELKIADPWGDSAWGCVAHVEEAVRNVPSVFVADDTRAGLATYLQRH